MRSLSHDWYPRPLPDNVVIGEGSWLHSAYSFVHCASRRDPAVVVGAHTGLYVGTHFELGPDGRVVIGDYTCIVGAMFATNSSVVVGDYVFIAGDVVLSDALFAVPGTGSCAPVESCARGDIVIDDGAWIGNNAVVLGGVHVGEGSIIAAGAIVDRDVPPGAVWAGNPGRVVRKEMSASGEMPA